ncbi:MAG: NB-ARC domain-containing protein, partial [Anaerolineae bacterium]
MENYCNFDIVIDGKAGHYTVCATAPDGGRTQPEPLRQISDDATRPLFAQLRSGSGVTAEALAELGIRMFDALFTRDVSRTYTAIQADLPPDQQLRLRLVVRPPELAVLPWELLYDPQERTHLSTSHGCPLVRYLETGKSFQAERIEGPLHVLYASAEPKDQRDLHLHKSLRNLRASLADLETQGQVELQVLEHATSKGLQEELGRGHHIFHFDGHATFDQDQGYLILEKDRQSDPFPGNLLASFVAGKGLRLVVLNACETASAVPADPLAGVAQQLVVTGRLPVVVAMQFRIMNRSAAAFTQQFYGALAAGFAIEGAVAEGRMAIMRNLGIEYRDHIDWAAPVLFMQTAKSHLWERPAVELERRRAIKLSGVPEPPPYFLARPAALQALKALVLGQTNAPAAVADRTPRVGLCGMGGTGKTVLAAGLARDGTVQQAFPDGIYWLVLGQEPKLTARQAQLARALGEPTPRFDDSEQGKACLSELLDGKRCLLVLDDVWDVRHVAPFEALGPDCLMLVTTRDAQLLTALGAKECRLDVLDDESALKLLADWASQKVSDLPPEALQTAQECGNLPLALSMAGAMVRGKPDRWRNVLHRLQTADLARIRQQFPDYPYPDLLRMIEASVQTLEPDVQSRYLELAVFSKDTPVPEAVLGTLWRPAGLDAYDVQDVIDVLVDRSMAHRDKANRLALHDLLHDYVHIQAKDHLPALHNRLLQAYANQCPGDWPSGPNDGYFFQHLAHHLKGAEREKEFYALLTRSPDWMEHKFLACAGDTAYLADLKLALTDFADPLTPAQLQTLVGLHTAQRVVHERVRTYSDADLKTLVWLDRGAEALSHTRLRASAWGRLRGLLAICHTLREKGRPNPALLDEAAEAASEIQAGEGWAAAQGALAAALAQAGRFTKARKTADGIEDREQRASALSELAAALARSGRFVQARKTASQIRDPALEASALSILGAALVKAGRDDEADTAFKQAQETACGIQDDERQASALRDLAAALTEAERLDQARGVAQKIESYESWVDAL